MQITVVMSLERMRPCPVGGTQAPAGTLSRIPRGPGSPPLQRTLRGAGSVETDP